jgi:hypothetical protein
LPVVTLRGAIQPQELEVVEVELERPVIQMVKVMAVTERLFKSLACL